MTPDDARRLLGVEPSASRDEIRRAWRRAAKRVHPDVGGSETAMRRLNDALDVLLASDARPVTVPSTRRRRVDREESSFTIEVLPVEAFLALEIVGCEMGSIITSDPPYSIEFTLHSSLLDEGGQAWCRCDLVPEAGATTVHLTVGSDGVSTVPSTERVRDVLVGAVNAIDWPPV